ncbi:MAG: hypothetical protein EBZ60_09420 [Betaproteobacteria bacterium]|nr:hypothetical protein [Betaproteobacteria bacterium]
MSGVVEIADDVKILQSVVRDSRIGAFTSVGPFAQLRDGVEISHHVNIGNFVEVKKTCIDHHTNAAHLAYLGDAELGTDVNIGAGTITANYDPVRDIKERTIIADGAKVGSNSVLTLGFDYSFSDMKAGEIKSSGSTNKLQNLWSLSIAPGTLLNDKTMAYFKLGFENGRAVSSSGSELTKNITGSSWGLGLKTLMDKNTYVQVEVKQANFGTARMDGTSTDFTARGTAGSVGVGFSF